MRSKKVKAVELNVEDQKIVEFLTVECGFRESWITPQMIASVKREKERTKRIARNRP